MSRVLIVDDSLTVRMDLGEAFEEAGFEALCCESIERARAAVAQGGVSLVVSDVLLPDGDGVDLLAELREKTETADLPIFLLSTEAEVRDRIRGLSRGANEYIGKPYDASYVVRRAAAALRQRDCSDDGSAPAVLVIDDSRTYRQELSDQLREAGYRTISAQDGSEGLQLASDRAPDAIVVDGIMPEMDGTTIIRRVRLDPSLQSTPCLLLTAEEGAASEILALDAGADAYARKSEGTAVVLARLAAMLRSAPESRGRVQESAGTGPKKVLAVDDSRTYLEQLAEHLREEGWEVVKAQSGEQALELLSVEPVDGILLDLLMPGLSGTETCRRIKGAPLLRNIPLIMLTALDDEESMIDGINAGADDYVAKSHDFGVLKARLRAQLRRKHVEDENRSVRERILQKEAEARAARELADARSELLQQLEAKNAELDDLNRELQMFAHSVSHDLRQPLRTMDGFSEVLLQQYAASLDDKGRHYLERVRAGAQRMGALIDGLLVLSRVTRKEIERESLSVGTIVHRVIDRLREADPDRNVVLDADEELQAHADAQLLETVFENLLGNAWKFTAERDPARIEIGKSAQDDRPAYFVADNGVGFKMDYADKLFGPFQRLHSERQFEGTGIGLATVQRIVHRHGGQIWAHSEAGQGATFYFTLGAGAGERGATV